MLHCFPRICCKKKNEVKRKKKVKLNLGILGQFFSKYSGQDLNLVQKLIACNNEPINMIES